MMTALVEAVWTVYVGGDGKCDVRPVDQVLSQEADLDRDVEPGRL